MILTVLNDTNSAGVEETFSSIWANFYSEILNVYHQLINNLV